MISRFVITCHQIWMGLPNRILAYFYKKCFSHCGKNVRLRPCSSIIKGLNNISIGNDVSIPRHATILCTKAPLIIGNKVTFGPSPTIITGDHRIDEVGKYIIDNHEKKEENDQPIIFEDDVWVGANATILKGVRVGRGSVIGACSLVTKSIPPYSVVGGIPAKVLGFRFSINEIIEHEKLLYPENKRFTNAFLGDLLAPRI